MSILGDLLEPIRELIPGVSESKEAQRSYERTANEITNRINNEWTLPEYDQTPLTPEEYKILTQYKPEIAAYIQQEKPQLIPTSTGEGRQAQLKALEQLQGLSKTGVDEGMKSQLEEAQISADQALRSRRANALAALNSRGLGSSGATLNADIQSALGASEQQRMADVQAAIAAANRKSQAIQLLGNLGSQVEGQEQQRKEFNANTLNQYNQLLANRKQSYEDYVANTHNTANQYNQRENQRIAEANAGLRNQANMYNRNRDDTNRSNIVNAKNEKLKVIAGQQGNLNASNYANAMQQAGNQTQFFGQLVGTGIGAAAGGLPGAFIGSQIGGGRGGSFIPVPYSSSSTPQSSGYMNPNYNSSQYEFTNSPNTGYKYT